MKHWNTKKFKNATMSEAAQVEALSAGWGLENLVCEDFFADRRYSTYYEKCMMYLHSLMQYVQSEYFEGLGYKKVFETSTEGWTMTSSPVIEQIECDVDKTFLGYSKGIIGYENGEGKRLVVYISVQDHDEGYGSYRLFTEDKDITLVAWKELAKKKNFYKNKKITATARFLRLSNVSWSDVILPNNVKKLLQSMVTGALKNQEIYKRNKLPLKTGIMLTGTPGNGKTSAVRVIAKEADVTVVYAQPSNLTSSENVRVVCEMVRDLAPAILVIEDIDWIAEDRDTGDAGRVIELMNQLDGLEDFTGVITIATTNNLEKIEKAIKNRPGRFDRIIKIENPDKACRKKMIELFCKNYDISKLDLGRMVGLTEGLSGAHMADLCNTSARHAVEVGSYDDTKQIILLNEHFDAAVEEVRNKEYVEPTITKRSRGCGFHALLEGDD